MQKKQLYITVAGAVVILCAIIIFFQARSILFPKLAETYTPQVESQASPEASPNVLIEDVKDRPSEEPRAARVEPVSLAQVYTQYPKEDTGNNVVESWAKLSPEDKAKVDEQLDKKIVQAKEELKINPDNKNSKHVLFVSETLKRLCKNNFNYSLLESVPEDQGGLKKKGK